MNNMFYGFGTIFRAELSKWFKTRKFILNFFIWLIVFNGFMFYVFSRQETFFEAGMGFSDIEKAQLFTMPVGMFGVFGAIILMHNVLAGEIEGGITSWILSKPVSRFSYLLSKLVANIIGVFVTMFPIQIFLTYWIYIEKGNMLISFSNLIMASFLLFLQILFYIFLTMFCNIFLKSRIGILAIPFAIYFLQQYIGGIINAISNYLPYNLVTASTVILTGEKFNYIPTVSLTIILICILFMLSARRFSKMEL